MLFEVEILHKKLRKLNVLDLKDNSTEESFKTFQRLVRDDFATFNWKFKQIRT